MSSHAPSDQAPSTSPEASAAAFEAARALFAQAEEELLALNDLIDQSAV